MEGIQIAPIVSVAGSELVLNGTGLRQKGPAKIGVVALYAAKSFRSFDEFISLPGAKHAVMTVLRPLPYEMLGYSLTKGFNESISISEMGQLAPSMLRLGQLDIFSHTKVLKPGETVVLDWIPGSGMVITVAGKAQGEPFPELSFYRAVMAVWLGASPIDPALKTALLGER